MPQNPDQTPISTREFVLAVAPFALLAFVLLALAYWWMKPTPPKHVTLATGPAQSAYAEFGKRYASELAHYGITVTLRETEGSSANLKLLRAGEADVGFVQGGTSDANPKDEDSLESLGSLFVEPVWLFYKTDAKHTDAKHKKTIASLTDLAGLRLNIGTDESGLPNLMLRLLEANRIDPSQIKLSKLAPTPATVALLGGEIDALVFASAPESPLVQMLLMTPSIQLMDFDQQEAYSRRFPFLSAVNLPRGVVDLATGVPLQTVRLVAPTTSLVANNKTHPALLHLFSMAAHKLHDGAGWFNKTHEYPNTRYDELPIAAEADRYIKNGTPFLQRQLPFWLANLIDRMWVALGVILAVLLPLSKVLPPLYRFRIRRRIFRWYRQLREIEDKAHNLAAQDSTNKRSALQADLDKLEQHVARVSVPLSYVDELYALKGNIQLVRGRIL